MRSSCSSVSPTKMTPPVPHEIPLVSWVPDWSHSWMLSCHSVFSANHFPSFRNLSHQKHSQQTVPVMSNDVSQKKLILYVWWSVVASGSFLRILDFLSRDMSTQLSTVSLQACWVCHINGNFRLSCQMLRLHLCFLFVLALETSHKHQLRPGKVYFSSRISRGLIDPKI